MGDLQDTLDDLAGFDWVPGIRKILNGFQEVADAATAGKLDADATQTTLTLLANPHGPDLPQALALLAAHLMTQHTNPALAFLDDDTVKTVQRLGEQHVFETAEYTPRDHPNEAAGLIYEAAEGRSQAMTYLDDAQRKELSDKVKKVNKDSQSRPR
ncbi:hypothetical protein [Streptomyces sp. NPDC047939]|uniref:hypothetical protein n=1 Tax=Streptomyces sp. NPDC047939 TaxID=3155381 RepID=UPI00344015BE